MFTTLKKQVQERFKKISKDGALYRVKVDRDKIWSVYLDAFEDEQEKQEHNCNCCKSFLREHGGTVTLKKGEIISLWDLNLESLDKIAVAVDEDIQKEGRKSFIGKTNRGSSQKALSLEILKFIIEDKMKEEDKKKERAQKSAQKEFLMELLNKKKLESLESLPLEEIQKQIDDLS